MEMMQLQNEILRLQLEVRFSMGSALSLHSMKHAYAVVGVRLLSTMGCEKVQNCHQSHCTVTMNMHVPASLHDIHMTVLARGCTLVNA